MINEISKCWSDTVYLLATLRLPPTPPVVGSSQVVDLPDSRHEAPSDDRMFTAMRRAALSLARVALACLV